MTDSTEQKTTSEVIWEAILANLAPIAAVDVQRTALYLKETHAILFPPPSPPMSE